MRKIFTMVLFFIAGDADSQEVATPETKQRQDSVILEEAKENLLDNVPAISLSENDLDDQSSQNISSLLTAGRDPFYSAAVFNFSAARFHIRGYDGDAFSTYMNGIPMDNLDNGFTPYGLWGGLNDVMRNRDVSMGLRYNTFAFGDIGNSTSIDSRASRQRKQTSFSYALSNRGYVHRAMVTHSTGMNKYGWAFTLSGSRRFADEGYVPGTFYNGWSYFIGLDKRLAQKHLISLVIFGAPTENGRLGAATEEMTKLSGTHYYNPYWGYQNGKKRNASVSKINQPVVILTHDLRINNNTSLTTAAGYSFGNKSISGLDWYNAPDPRPDYYRYMPSYQKDPNQSQQVETLLANNEPARQINWQNLYDVNRDSYATIPNADGIPGNTISGRRSHYVLQERITNTGRFNFNMVFHSRLSNRVQLTAGESYQYMKNNYYQKLNDLLGGDFYVDLNQFAERDFPNDANAIQNDLNHPNRILHTGDKYGYNYNIDISKIAAWAQTVFQFNRFDFFIAGEISRTEFWRTGNVRNGLFPEDSYGKSSLNVFNNFAVKGGFTYKINGRNYLYINAATLTKAPYFENAYISPHTRDFIQENLASEEVQTAEAAYILNAPHLKLRAGGYYTVFRRQFNVLSFYSDAYSNFVNYALSGIDKVHFGGEFGAEAKIADNLTVNAAAAIGRYYYNSRQHAIITVDNSAQVLNSETVYSQNFRIPSTPQEAYTLGITYRSPKFWFLSLSSNYFNQMWLDFNPIRRTYAAVEGIDPKSDLWQSIVNQTKLPSQFTLDLFAGYSWKVSKNTRTKKAVYLVFNAGLNNLLDNKNIISGGYEQLRFDFDNHDVNKFPPKYYYAYGMNYFMSATVRF